MPVSVDTREALDLKNLPVLPGVRVLRIDAEDFSEWSGDPALRITVVFEESPELENMSGNEVGDFKQAIRESLRSHGINLFAYFVLTTPSELAEPDED